MYTWPPGRSSAEGLLPAETGAMKAPKKNPQEPTESVSIRLPSREVRRLERQAKAAFMKRGTYLALQLIGEEPEPWPALAALAHVIAIHEAVLARGAVTEEQLQELRSLVREFAKLANWEAVR